MIRRRSRIEITAHAHQRKDGWHARIVIRCTGLPNTDEFRDTWWPPGGPYPTRNSALVGAQAALGLGLAKASAL